MTKAKRYLHKGKLMTVQQLSKRYNVKEPTLWARLSAGIPVENALGKNFAVRSDNSQASNMDCLGLKGTFIGEWICEYI